MSLFNPIEPLKFEKSAEPLSDVIDLESYLTPIKAEPFSIETWPNP